LLIKEPENFLADPQQLNSYSYGRNNPVRYVDPTGEKISEYQPYYSDNGFYDYENSYGNYRGTDVISAGIFSGQGWHNYQCVDLVKKFTNKQYGVDLGQIGHAQAYGYQSSFSDFNDNNSGQYTVYDNGSFIMPQENDIISWSGGSYGHVAIIAEVSFDPDSGEGYVYTLEQNYNGYQGLYTQSLKRSYNQSGQEIYTVANRNSLKVQGWTRYSEQNSIPYSNILYTHAPKGYVYE